MTTDRLKSLFWAIVGAACMGGTSVAYGQDQSWLKDLNDRVVQFEIPDDVPNTRRRSSGSYVSSKLDSETTLDLGEFKSQFRQSKNLPNTGDYAGFRFRFQVDGR